MTQLQNYEKLPMLDFDYLCADVFTFLKAHIPMKSCIAWHF